MMAQMPPFFWASAIVCIATVVLPEDSGPYISMILPLGKPPIPSAISRPSEPVDITSMGSEPFSPIIITDPLPKSFSILSMVRRSAFHLSALAVDILVSVFYKFNGVLSYDLIFDFPKIFSILYEILNTVANNLLLVIDL